MHYYGIDYDDTSLMHYGVKGMKWGVRKKKTVDDKISNIWEKNNLKRIKYEDKMDKHYRTAKAKKAKANAKYDKTVAKAASKRDRKISKIDAKDMAYEDKLWNKVDKAERKADKKAHKIYKRNGIQTLSDLDSETQKQILISLYKSIEKKKES